ncbi:MAG: site-specific integrase [Bacteroidales bacterium]
MASVKIKLRENKNRPQLGTLYIQIIHNRKSKQLCTDIIIHNKQWNNITSTPIICNNSDHKRLEGMLTKLDSTINYLENKKQPYTVTDIISTYNNYHVRWFFNYMEQTIENLQSYGKERTAETYIAALRSFRRFRKDKDIELNLLDNNIINSYYRYLFDLGIAPNSIIFYMRILRATYNRAVDDNIIPNANPFKNISTKSEKTLKRAIAAKQIRAIRDLDLSKSPKIAFARDIFIFSFYTRGMSFVDIAYLRKRDLNDDTLSYRRRKTNQLLHIHWEQCMQTIVERYAHLATHTPYLLPIITDLERDRHIQYKTAIYTVNSKLKQIGKILKIPANLTTYVARHSWASIAHSKNIPLSVISQGMGHDNENTTQIYLASLDRSVIDKANRLVINSL